MKINFRQTSLAAAVSSAMLLGFSGQAAATLYAGSSLNIEDLSIGIGELTFDGENISGIDPSVNGVTTTSFNFNLTNTAALNTDANITTDVCNGTGPASHNCGADANDPPDTLYAGAVNAPLSDFLRTDNDYAGADSTFEWYGITAGDDWANADSIIHTAQLAGDATTDTDQIAEAKLTDEESAASSSSIQSTTGFTFTFEVEGPDPIDMLIGFTADPDLYAEILGEILAGYEAYSASADIAVSFTLSQNTGGTGFARWAPNGTVDGGCITNLTSCTELADDENLNTDVGTTADNTSDALSYEPNSPVADAFGVALQGLTAGSWTLVLQAKTSTLLTHSRPVPAPGVLSLFGLGLLGLGGMVRRRRNA